jgi:hypothetical protein
MILVSVTHFRDESFGSSDEIYIVGVFVCFCVCGCMCTWEFVRVGVCGCL